MISLVYLAENIVKILGKFQSMTTLKMDDCPSSVLGNRAARYEDNIAIFNSCLEYRDKLDLRNYFNTVLRSLCQMEDLIRIYSGILRCNDDFGNLLCSPMRVCRKRFWPRQNGGTAVEQPV